jgi:phenylacetic acid degradation operon negative regulatory protein
MTMTIESASRKLVTEFKSRRTVRAGSLITTVFGDAIAPRGGTVWLGSLITVMQGFGISERLVRTSVFRLAKDGWLQSNQIGRRSYYGLTDEGRERFQQATHKIYGEPATTWDGEWCLIFLTDLDATIKENVRKELGWLGFGSLSTAVLAHPTPNRTDLDVTLRRLGVSDDVIVMRGMSVENESSIRKLARYGWSIDDIDSRYASFVERFRPLIAAYSKSGSVKPQTAFLIRTLLIQEYRKVLLRDPQLPAELLPADWHGSAAYQLCRNLYRAVYAAADEYMSTVMETANGPLPPPSGDFMQRFAGLE